MKEKLLKNNSVRIRNSSEKEKYTRKQFYLYYTLSFIVVFLLGFCWYFIFGKTFISDSDGWEQHYKAMVYYVQYLRGVAKNLLFNHVLYFPQWDFALGEGNDILQSLNYYVIGDPFALPCVFVPVKYMWVYFDFSIILRMYLSGITFSALCFYMNKNSGKIAVMAGTLSYVFCYWAILSINKHPYFFNPMVFFPLVILGIEKIIKKDKPFVFILAVFFSGMSNFYFFYMIVILTVVYVVVRALVLYKSNFKEGIALVFRVALFSLIGVAMAAVIVLPVCYDFLNDARTGAQNAYHILYPFYHYTRLPRVLFSGKKSYWLCMGYSTCVILASVLLFRRKGHKTLKILLIVSMVLILIPFFGQVLNGMSYRSNRWSWALALLCCYTSVVMWPELMRLKKKDVFTMFVFLGICFLISLLSEEGRSEGVFAGIAMAFLFIAVILYYNNYYSKEAEKKYRAKQITALVLSVISILNICFLDNAPSTRFAPKKSIYSEKITSSLKNNETKAIKSLEKKQNSGFCRYSGSGITLNAGTLAGISGTDYYWSISNAKISEFSKDIDLAESMPQKHFGYDDRASVLGLSSVLYYSVHGGNKNSRVPYGFEYVGTYKSNGKPADKKSKSNYAIFKNKNFLPIAYTYDNAFGDDTWKKLSAVQKQEAMLQSVYISDYDGKENKIDTNDKKLNCDIVCNGDNISLKDNKFIVTKANSTAELSFEGLPDSETYLNIKGLDFKALSNFDLYFGTKYYKPEGKYNKKAFKKLSAIKSEKIVREKLYWHEPTNVVLDLKSSEGNHHSLEYFNKDFSWYSNRHDFAVNMGYNKKAVNSIKITFPEKGVYYFDDIGITCQPMSGFDSHISALKRDALESVKIGKDSVKGEINLDKEKYLCLSIPYSEGWTAYVDGKETKLLQANEKNMALRLSPGKHKIELKYQTPMLKYGVVISIAAAILFFAMLIISSVRSRKKRRNDNTVA